MGAADRLPLMTARLRLRPFTHDDVDDLHAVDGDARVMRTIGSGLPPRTRAEVAATIERIVGYYSQRPGLGLLHASRSLDGEFVGGCGLFPLPDDSEIEIAYRLRHACWGRGYATEAAAAVLAYGFEVLELRRIVGLAFPANIASQRVLEKIGMQDRGNTFHYGRELRCFVAERRA